HAGRWRHVRRRHHASRRERLSTAEFARRVAMVRGVNRYDLAARSIVVTGGAGGIGCAIARLLLDSGARVSLWDLSEPALAQAAARWPGKERLLTRRVDVTDDASIAAALAADVLTFGRIDALVNNAGILGEVRPLWETTPADFRRVIEVNLIGAYLCLR